MCGIVAYMGAAEAHTVMLAGLARLEYRGYDSAGLAVMQESAANAGAATEKPGGGASREGSSSAAGATSPATRSPRTAKPASTLKVVKAAGKVSNLANACKGEAPRGTLGIAHTRWATHGPPTDVNAHPHTSSDGTLAVVHNGIVENFRALRTEMLRKGYELRSDTDTELIAHLIADVRKQQWMPLEEAVRQALTQVEGAFGLAVVSSEEPDLLIGARKGSPLILGIGDDEYLLASDAAAVIERTRRVAYLNDGELVVISRQPGGFASYEIKTLDNVRLCREVQQLEMTLQVTGGRCRHHRRGCRQPVARSVCRARILPRWRGDDARRFARVGRLGLDVPRWRVRDGRRRQLRRARGLRRRGGRFLLRRLVRRDLGSQKGLRRGVVVHYYAGARRQRGAYQSGGVAADDPRRRLRRQRCSLPGLRRRRRLKQAAARRQRVADARGGARPDDPCCWFW